MKHLITLLFAMAPLLSLQAQPPGMQKQSLPYSDECLLNTTDEAWASIGLSTEQLAEVRSIQTLCETDCTALQETGERDPELAQAMLEKHRENIRAVLTKEQYGKWLTWCDDRPAKG
jgi:hypothetical protein